VSAYQAIPCRIDAPWGPCPARAYGRAGTLQCGTSGNSQYWPTRSRPRRCGASSAPNQMKAGPHGRCGGRSNTSVVHSEDLRFSRPPGKARCIRSTAGGNARTRALGLHVEQTHNWHLAPSLTSRTEPAISPSPLGDPAALAPDVEIVRYKRRATTRPRALQL